MSTAMTPADPRSRRTSTASASRSTPARERADIILDRPPFNIISMPQRDQLRLVFEALDEDARVRMIVLRAVGEHFSSGGNIKGFLEASPGACVEARLEHRRAGALLQAGDRRQPRLYFGVGFEISLACDFRIVSETCHYALPEQKLGQIPGSGGSARLQKIVGITRTKDIVMRSKAHSRPSRRSNGASRQTAWPTTSSKRRPTRWLTSCGRFSPIAQRTAKKLLNDTEDATLSIAIELKGTATAACASRTISARASRPSTTSARRSSGVASPAVPSTTWPAKPRRWPVPVNLSAGT